MTVHPGIFNTFLQVKNKFRPPYFTILHKVQEDDRMFFDNLHSFLPRAELIQERTVFPCTSFPSV